MLVVKKVDTLSCLIHCAWYFDSSNDAETKKFPKNKKERDIQKECIVQIEDRVMHLVHIVR
jgi:hypothetical protein